MDFLRGRSAQTVHQLCDECVGLAGREKGLGAPLPEGKPGALFTEQRLAAIHSVLKRVVPVENLDGVGEKLLRQAPIADGTVAEPEHRMEFLGLLNAQRVLQDRREFSEPFTTATERAESGTGARASTSCR